MTIYLVPHRSMKINVSLFGYALLDFYSVFSARFTTIVQYSLELLNRKEEYSIYEETLKNWGFSINRFGNNGPSWCSGYLSRWIHNPVFPGSKPGSGKVDSAFHPSEVGDMNSCVTNAVQVCCGCADRQRSHRWT